MTTKTAVTVRVPAKVNLQLAVGPAREDGYHDLVNVFHAVALFDEVTVTGADSRAEGACAGLGVEDATGGGLAGHVARVPVDGTNLAARAAELVAEACGGPGAVAPVRLLLRKAIPVAGGMAGGSADAAAALVACNAWWDAGLTREDLLALAARLGSDVAFPLLGGTAVGTGRGEVLTPVESPGRYHWVFALAEGGLSTPEVFAAYDRLRPEAPAPAGDPELMAALAAGDARRLGAALSNDLQPAALELRPELGAVLECGRAAGALGAFVSGSGPTCAFLAASADHAAAVAGALEESGRCERAVTAHGDVPGATLL
ncbi:4-(cytidine 5'-diphospho)-2-C-methyl-D-erythritol kinase [Streptomonospora sp. NEAU-YY374]|uniref:4-diphosphocytidyl-2-C-methyl-D-erythritol kinase n=1 Tax=Streptomonospora nanhaiensis TaxID=1323731 RepID=A0A853BNH0_9ACTN|nr:4-(cytidine 5'-diphospho)-2-C-methyl-D-erythritol kinase [Streptomonospora nanhaiensis]MBV2362010.1 4-(cytidine 5'-diphospho)-2-C-methyl-D-erythritol kinase [Streptomonospora nanhaiensis]MBX9386757.1 4-(cytidine 5'-diphospho)-2-C-methyl-D-erythritol kinase [Streptomonospora nanhaiensis]NYI96166.1 4-diphosphocytidyl-2-C-methyl-D-erythritol kinase [Streptomonospora nanhaiensis]